MATFLWSRLTVVLASTVGLAAVAAGLMLPPGGTGLAWFVPFVDAATVLCLLVAGSVAGSDVIVRQERSALPYIGMGSILAPLWMLHLLSFTGRLRLVGASVDSGLLVHLDRFAMPVLLIWVLLQPGGPLPNPRRTVVTVVGAGLLVVAAAVAISLVLAGPVESSALAGTIPEVDGLLLGAEILAVLAAAGLVMTGRRGDPRFATAVIGAIVLLGFEAAVQVLSKQAFDAAWYAATALQPDPPLVMMAGLLGLYAGSVRALLAAEARHRTLEETGVHLKGTVEALEYRTLHDTLTELPNRAFFGDRLQQALLAADRDRQPRALLMLDLDGFKHVNDTLGHDQGDRILQGVARRLHRAVRKADTVARIGGDEFVVLLAGAADTTRAILVAEKLLAAFERPFQLGKHRVNVGCSIGIAIYPGNGHDAATLERHADAAMYVAKRARNGYRV